ncbi:hypothetical protein JZ751_023151 [Albula glossodonta]|uniref:Linker for activation of T-cells family member 2 n=1 Tax=Albula glossodonta TaxID=121402 RepID=A0A8T2PI75_9TELE|nr:hypothetical protein JZ751_023151 [Albula glossodonta]
MTAILNQQEAGLAVASFVCLGVLCAMCLRCHKKSTIIREDNSIYNQELVREGRRFTVLRSKTVRLNQTTRDLPPTPQEAPEVICSTSLTAEVQPNYQNVSKSRLGDFEPMYVDPIPNSVYQNITTDKEKDADTNSYENVFPTVSNPVSEDSESSDYQNTDFLEEMKEEEDEPDYVNTETEMKT